MLLLTLLACGGPDESKDDTGGGRPVRAPNVVLNEFLASNDTVNVDEAGEYDDWVELYNAGDTAVDFAGLYLTDDREGAPTRWPLPEGGLQPGEFALFWADDTPDQGATHMNFKLAREGDQISLTFVSGGADPILVDAVVFEKQAADLSFGRVPDGSLEWVQGTPTPDASNG